MLYYQMELCASMYKYVYWLYAPHSYASPMGARPRASTRVHPPGCIRTNCGYEKTG